MPRPIYRRGREYAETMRALLYHCRHPERDEGLESYQRALVEQARSLLAPREFECLCSYYLRRRSIMQSAEDLRVNQSTVCRNIHRGEAKVDKLLQLAREISPVRFQLMS